MFHIICEANKQTGFCGKCASIVKLVALEHIMLHWLIHISTDYPRRKLCLPELQQPCSKKQRKFTPRLFYTNLTHLDPSSVYR